MGAPSTVNIQHAGKVVSTTNPLPVTSDATAQAQLAALATAIGTASDAAGDPTVIGLLKQIAANTATP